jgi:hypothetical protein
VIVGSSICAGEAELAERLNRRCHSDSVIPCAEEFLAERPGAEGEASSNCRQASFDLLSSSSGEALVQERP